MLCESKGWELGGQVSRRRWLCAYHVGTMIGDLPKFITRLGPWRKSVSPAPGSLVAHCLLRVAK